MERQLLKICLISLLLTKCHYVASKGEKKYTPEKFLNKTTYNSKLYANDKHLMLQQLISLKENNVESFHSREYFDSTVIKIDTILYDEGYARAAIFITTKNPTYRQLDPNQEYEFYYNAYCYLGIRRQDSFQLKWLKVFSLINFYNEEDITEEILKQYFTEFATLKDSSGQYAYKFNLDDKRFWNSEIWENYFK